MRVPNHELMPAIARVALARGARARFRVCGGSMAPFIRSEATVTVEPYGLARVRRGDIALAQRSNGTYVLHRVASVDGERIFLLGDAQERFEGPFAPRQLLGRVVRVEQGGRTLALGRPVWRAAGLLWLALRPWRGGLLGAGRGVRRLGRKWRRGAPPAVPEAGREFDLLLCCARVQVSAEAAQRARELLARGVDWEVLVTLAEQHGLVPLVYRSLQSSAPEAVPEEITERLRADYHATARRSLGLLAETTRLLSALEAGGVPVVPYKGPVVAALIYEDVALRECSDIDLLIDPADIARAEKILITQGYRPEQIAALTGARARALLAFAQDKVFSRQDGRVTVELHWRPTSFPFLPGLDRLALWTRCRSVPFGGAQIRLPAPEDVLVLLCLHGYKHLFWSLKWICDIAELSRACPALDYGRVVTEAGVMGSARAVLIGLLLAADLLEAPIPPEVLARARADRPAALTMKEIVRRLRADEAPACDRRGSLRDLLLCVKAVDGFRNRVRFCLRWRTPQSTESIKRVRLPSPLVRVYWAAALAGFLQRRVAGAAWVVTSLVGLLWTRGKSQRAKGKKGTAPAAPPPVSVHDVRMESSSDGQITRGPRDRPLL